MKTNPSHWSLLTLVLAAAGGLLRRRMAADPPAGMGLPPAADDVPPAATPTQSAVHGYAFAGCSDREIADRFGLGEADVRDTFAAVLIMARAQRVYALRSAQTELARKGNAPMLTWLGRNELGQALSPGIHGVPEPELE